MNETTLVVYVGAFESGTLVDPATGVGYAFKKDEPFEVPSALAATLGSDYEPAEIENLK
jgi:hypothetical protein